MKTIEFYQQELKARGYQSDPAQLRAVERLQKCEDEWIAYKEIRSNTLKKKIFKPNLPRGLYLWGGVGRGKSFLMDCFYAASPLEKKIRIHFHEFMREVHRELHELSGLSDPLDELAKRISNRYRLICFDEFHINDIADAMILYRLLSALFADRVQFVMTSNYRPDQLYPNGLHRDRLLPAIKLLEEKLDVLRSLLHGFDYSNFLSGGHSVLAKTANHVLGIKDGKKRFGDTALAMSKAFTLCCTLDEAKAVREEVAFFQAVLAFFMRKTAGAGDER